jgi:hypothetical protein
VRVLPEVAGPAGLRAEATGLARANRFSGRPESAVAVQRLQARTLLLSFTGFSCRALSAVFLSGIPGPPGARYSSAITDFSRT